MRSYRKLVFLQVEQSQTQSFQWSGVETTQSTTLDIFQIESVEGLKSEKNAPQIYGNAVRLQSLWRDNGRK